MSETLELFATVATADKIDAGVGVIWFAKHPSSEVTLTVVDYDIFDIRQIDAEWVESIFERTANLEETHWPTKQGCMVRVEHLGIVNMLKRADDAFRETEAADAVNRTKFDIKPISKEYEATKWPATLDDRAFAIRPLVDSGKVVKFEPGLPRISFRAIRTNHLVKQIKQHRPGDAASAGELLHAFVLGVLLGTTPKRGSFFDMQVRGAPKSTASDGPFGFGYVPGRRPL